MRLAEHGAVLVSGTAATGHRAIAPRVPAAHDAVDGAVGEGVARGGLLEGRADRSSMRSRLDDGAGAHLGAGATSLDTGGPRAEVGDLFSMDGEYGMVCMVYMVCMVCILCVCVCMVCVVYGCV
jgi:hypothetical protein